MLTVNSDLAYYRSISEYTPQSGDYVIWSGWITTWHGIVADFNTADNTVGIIWAGIPCLLFTMDSVEQKQETRYIPLLKLKQSVRGKFAILQYDKQKNNIWFI